MSDPDIPPAKWLDIKVKEYEEHQELTLQLPKHGSGKDYTIEGLYRDQQFILFEILSVLHEFTNKPSSSTFKPLRCIINGPAGTGKTVLINTLVSLIRSVYCRNDVVRVVAPTGTAAFNVGGETFHHLLEMKVSPIEYRRGSMQKAKRSRLIQKFRNLLCLVVDERSLVNSQLLGTAETMIAETAMGGNNPTSNSWGGIPVVILVGNDYQLQGTKEGAIECRIRSDRGPMTRNGRAAFIECAQTVYQLHRIRRVGDDRVGDKDLMNRVRLGEEILDDDCERLLNLRLDRVIRRHGKAYAEGLARKAIYLFYTNEKRIRHNVEMVAQASSPERPVAFIRARSTGGRYGKGVKSHFNNMEIPNSAMLFEGARGCLENRNICPQWGLHNGACGTVEEVVFEEKANPNDGHFPTYVVVDFPLYQGPAWDKERPTVRVQMKKIGRPDFFCLFCFSCILYVTVKAVPIPVVNFPCTKGCCERTYVPLGLAYARTIHKFQGLSAGPVDEGKIPNMYHCIICDPDNKKFEGRCTGLLYTALSRATTLGDETGRHLAIYFTGEFFNYDRIKNLAKKHNGKEEYENVIRRRTWVDFLRSHTKTAPRAMVDGNIQQNRKVQTIFQWAKTAKVTTKMLHEVVHDYRRACGRRADRRDFHRW